jgi:polyisoprenoid-binding protein YceI
MLSIWVVSCSKDNNIEAIPGGNQHGNMILDSRAGGNYGIDKSHSNVMWETMYFGDNALLTGRFNAFDISIYFNEANIAMSEIKAWVQLSAFNTGEPGRDAYGKCGPGYMGVVFDTAVVSPLQLIPRASTDTAWFNSTSVEYYGTGYLAKGQLTFKNVTKNVDLFFNYEGEHEYTTSTGTRTYSGFSGHFYMNAITDFSVSSTSIADQVKVVVNANYRKN